ncbi:MAG: hypothetical protein LC800_16875 [Acidobacteria bacterium]|nr:hypothetical protein [Acidobacteriota bacterium]
MRSRYGKTGGAGQTRGAADQRGFTVIESTIGMLILMVAALGVASMFTYAANHNAGGVSRTIALTVAQHRLELLRDLPFDSAQLAATAVNPAPQTVTRSGGTFQVTTIIADAAGSAPLPATAVRRKTITVRVTPLGKGFGYAAAPVTLVTTRTAYANGPYLE